MIMIIIVLKLIGHKSFKGLACLTLIDIEPACETSMAYPWHGEAGGGGGVGCGVVNRFKRVQVRSRGHLHAILKQENDV